MYCSVWHQMCLCGHAAIATIEWNGLFKRFLRWTGNTLPFPSGSSASSERSTSERLFAHIVCKRVIPATLYKARSPIIHTNSQSSQLWHPLVPRVVSASPGTGDTSHAAT